MDAKEALHTIARRHCTERQAYWAEAYSRLEAGGGARKPVDKLQWEYTQQAYVTFPRYLVWQAMLDELERVEPRSLSTIATLREALAAAGRRAQTSMTANRSLPTAAIAAMEEEREAFRNFIMAVPESEFDTVDPLDVRRVFHKEELERIWATLNGHWDVTTQHHWWPLREGTPPLEVAAFHTDWFVSEKIDALRELLVDHGVGLVWELREFGEWGCEQSVRALDPVYNGEEGYWTSATSEWLVYASHESSISLAGGWLTQGFRERFPDCDHFPYQGPMSTPDQRGTWKW